MSQHVLVTGGAGYIGSHVCKALSISGFIPVTYDNLLQGHNWAVNWGPLIIGDLQDAKKLDETFAQFQPIAVIHLASHINVRESQQDPGKYYQNNVGATLALLSAMSKHKTSRFVFSSTAAVYGIPSYTPIDENHPKSPINVYGRTKLMAEEIISDFFHCHGIAHVIFRYFNAAGADSDAEIGEAHDPETHLIPKVIQAALQQEPLTIFGKDHPTHDGTAVRDYVHVMDLADAHVKAVKWLLENPTNLTVNLGSGVGFSILEVIRQVEALTGSSIAIEWDRRFPGDPPILIAEAAKAKTVLGWEAKHSDLKTIVQTAWNWHSKSVVSSL